MNQNGLRKPRLAAWLAIILTACVDIPDCDLSGCPRQTYGISAYVLSPMPPYRTLIESLDTGQLNLQVHRKTASLPKFSAVTATDCIGCEDILENSTLSFDQPILAGTDTIPAFTNLLDEAVLPKVGSGGPGWLIFHGHIRFRKGENRIAFTSEFREGSKKTGTLRLDRSFNIGDRSAW